MTKILLAPCLICTLFTILFLIQDPDIYYESLMFKYRDSIIDIFFSVLDWIFLIGFIFTFTLIARMISSYLPSNI